MDNLRIYKDIIREITEEPLAVEDTADYFDCWDEYDEETGEPIGDPYCCFDTSLITADTTDEELLEIAKDAVGDAAANGVDISDTIDDFLLDIRDDRQLDRDTAE